MPGPCGLAQSTDGKFAVSSGTDATIRVHDIRDHPKTWFRKESPVEPELNPSSLTDIHEKPVPTLALSPNNLTLATGSEDGFVRIFSVNASYIPVANDVDGMRVQAELVQACARFAGPVRALDFSPTGAFIAAAGDEPGVVKIIMTAQPSNVNILRAGNNGPGNEAAVALAFDPRGDFVAAIGERGNAVVWDIEKCVLAGAVELNGRKAHCVAWSPDGHTIVFGTDKGAVLVARSSWMFDSLLEDAGDKDDDDEIFTATSGKDSISAVAWSANGKYLLTGRENSSTSLWDMQNRKVLGAWKSEEVPHKLLWHPKSNTFMLIDKIGQWALVTDVVPAHMPPPNSQASTLQLPSVPNTNDAKKRSSSRVEDDEHVTVKRSKSAKARRQKEKEKKIKAGQQSSSNKKAKAPQNESALEPEEDDQELENGFAFNPSDVEADDEEDSRRDRRHRDSDGSESTGDSTDDSDSDEEIPGEFAGLENGGVQLPKRRSRKRRSRKGDVRTAPSARVAQAPFMPSSTPLSAKDNKKKHILVWNLVGAVLSFDETTHNVIEIEFAEASKRTIGIKDHFGYSMGCLSETGVLLASRRRKEHSSLISFRPFSSWANNSDWTTFLAKDEDISAVALGQRFIAVSTTPNNVIRLFSLSGIQTSVFGVPGRIVTVAAGGDRLVLVYAEPDSFALKCELLEITATGEVEKIIYSGCLMMCGNAALEWVGLTSDTADLCSYDSEGWLWVMTDTKASKRWVPMIQNAAKTADCDWFWVAAASSENLIGVPCLSNERYPSAKPRPALRGLPLYAPVIERITKSGKPTVIERFCRSQLKLQRAISSKVEAEDMYDSEDDEIAEAEEHISRMELETDKCVLNLMEEACKREQNMRALDLATRLHCRVSLRYAIELAKHYKRSALASRVEQVALRKLEVIEDDARSRRPQLERRTSPVTPQVIARRPALDSDSEGDDGEVANESGSAQKAASLRQKPGMQFDSDDDVSLEPTTDDGENKKEASPISGDDEINNNEEERLQRSKGEEAKTLPEGVADPQRSTIKPKVEPHPKKTERPQKKRRAPMQSSQASMKGAFAFQNNTKKARVMNANASKSGKGEKKVFRNRFMKKS